MSQSAPGYAPMVNAISDSSQSTEKLSLVLSLCESGRTTDDIRASDVLAAPTWLCVASIIERTVFALGPAISIDITTWISEKLRYDFKPSPLSFRTYEESETHIIVWALMKSPVLIGGDVRITSLGEILMNRKIIAIDQDPVVGAGVTPFRWGVNSDYISNDTCPAQYCSGEKMIFVMKVTNQIDTLDERATTIFNPTESPWIPARRQYSVRDLWVHSTKDIAVRNFTANDVPLYGVVALLLQDAGDEPEA
ncbi:hypothetical protein EDD17DRAFT_1851299 [Pisolithus thermaeus]|nr:hypothetical protein EV401DRAFT_2080053 [Pisolithus croceorrhizus]KAI6152852.1 hypothetical protein EDD17DRAFT_1851299 [Pisolithus thermaeus]